METNDLKKRKEDFKKRVDSMKNAHVLPEFPIKVNSNIRDKPVKQRKPMIIKNYIFEAK